MQNLWDACLRRLEQELPAQQFNTWIRPLAPEAGAGADTLVLAAPNRFVLELVRERFFARIERLAAEASGREARNVGKSAQETRRALDRAAQLLERVRGDLGDVVRSSTDWVQDLTRIAEAAGGTARAGKQVADLAQGISERAARIGQSLAQAQGGAHASTQEAEAVAAAAAEQLHAIEGLAHGATELAALADNLARAVRFVRGENGRQ